MGFWDKLFGRKNKDAVQEKQTAEAAVEPEGRDAGEGVPEEKAPGDAGNTAETPVEPVPAKEEISTPEPAAGPAEPQDKTAANPVQADETTAEEPGRMTESGGPGDEKAAAMPDISPALRRRLDTYFARLEEVYPDKVITRLNTGHKKLAERGAELRRLAGMEGELDRFFAMGGFTYRRGSSGRPPLPLTDADCTRMHQRVRELFPQGVSLVMAVRDVDNRLYLDLRAVARREGMTVGDYLRKNGLMADRQPASSNLNK